jgi:LysR family transcriptional regulator, glycine cleavage system transcriptional activator
LRAEARCAQNNRLATNRRVETYTPAMARKIPPLNAIRAFEAAGRHVSFTRAATELNVTHGAVSRQVSLLESWMGAPLFTRSASQLTLTDAGRIYLAEVTSIFDRLAVASMHMLDQPTPAALRISAPPTFAMKWLLSRISGFQRKRPDVEIRLTTSLAPVNFQENSYDIAIRGAHEPLAGCVSQPFMSELIVAVCHADLLDSGRIQNPGDLTGQTLISYATEPYAWADWLSTAGIADLKPRSSLKFEQMYFALQAAMEGLGVVLVPLFLAIDDIITGSLCLPFGTLAAKQRRYFANAAHPAPVVEVFYEWLLREGQDTEQSMAEWAVLPTSEWGS